jgi:hypothetical protein
VQGAGHRVLDPAAQVRAALRAGPDVVRGAARMARAMIAAAPALRPATSSLTGPIGPHRTWSWAKVSLADVKRVRAALGGTVNDVVLTVITNGFRDLLAERGEAIGSDRVVRTMVPVSVRRPGEHGVYNNRVSAVFARLPVGVQDPTQRLAAIREQMDGLKSSKQAVAGDVVAQLSGFAPPLLLALGSRIMTRSARLNLDTATTNVPGPQVPVHALGRRLLESYPYVPIVGTIRIVVAIFSYDGELYFGVTGDRDHANDIDTLTAGIESGASALLALALAQRGSGPGSARPAIATPAPQSGPAGRRHGSACERGDRRRQARCAGRPSRVKRVATTAWVQRSRILPVVRSSQWSDEECSAMPKQTQEPGPGRSTAEAAFNDVRREIAQRNEQAHQKARKLRVARDREQIIMRRQRDVP